MELFKDAEFWVLLAFLIAVAVLVWKAAPLIIAALDRRSGKIKSDLDEARRLREEAQRALAEYQRKQREALQEADDIIALARAEAEHAAAQGARDIEALLERRRRVALENIALEEAKAVAEVRAVAVDIAIAAVRRLLSEGLGAEKRGALVDDAIARLPQALG